MLPAYKTSDHRFDGYGMAGLSWRSVRSRLRANANKGRWAYQPTPWTNSSWRSPVYLEVLEDRARGYPLVKAIPLR